MAAYAEEPFIAQAASLIGDPARARMLSALMDGRALTATELAFIAGISAPTTSTHLGRLVDGRLVAVEKQGRHRYYRLANDSVAQALEALAILTQDGPPRHRPTGPRDDAMRFARTCYDHLAGRLGVAIASGMVSAGLLRDGEEDFELTDQGVRRLESIGIDLDAVKGRRRAFARRCLDWSERRAHLGGALGAAILDRAGALGWVERQRDSRAVTVTPGGREAFSDALKVTIPPG